MASPVPTNGSQVIKLSKPPVNPTDCPSPKPKNSYFWMTQILLGFMTVGGAALIVLGVLALIGILSLSLVPAMVMITSGALLTAAGVTFFSSTHKNEEEDPPQTECGFACV